MARKTDSSRPALNQEVSLSEAMERGEPSANGALITEAEINTSWTSVQDPRHVAAGMALQTQKGPPCVSTSLVAEWTYTRAQKLGTSPLTMQWRPEAL